MRNVGFSRLGARALTAAPSRLRAAFVPSTRLGACLAASFLIGACSTTVPSAESCTTNLECREAFGWGSTCQADGFCSAPQTHPRCTRVYPEDLFDRPQAHTDRQVFGALFGYADHLGTLRAAELAIRLADGRPDSPHPYGLITCDTGMGGGLDEQAATRETARYLREVIGVPAIIGPRGSTRTEAAWSELEDSDVVLISPSATSTTLTGLDTTMPTDEMPGRLWRTVPPDTLQSVAMATDLRARGVTRISVIHQAGSYGDVLADLLAEEFVARGGDAPTLEGYSESLADAVGRVTDDDVEEIVMISADIGDYITFLNIASSTSASLNFFEQRGLFFADGAYNERLYGDTNAAAQPLFDNIRGSRPAPAEGELFNTFAFEYFGAYGESPDALAYTAHSYDAAWLALYGSVWAEAAEGHIDGVGIARGLRQLSSGPAIELRVSSWADAVAALQAQQPVDVSGASGSLDFDPLTEETTAPIELWQLADGGGGDWSFERVGLIEPEVP